MVVPPGAGDVMIERPELHQDDPLNRWALNRKLWKLRNDAGLTAAGLGRTLGITRSAMNDMERDTSWAVRRVQAWSRGLRHEFRMTITGITVPDTDDLMAELYAIATPQDPAEADRLHLLTVVNDLIRVREHTGITYRELGQRMGVNDRAVRGWEHQPHGSLVKSAQRYARAIGGALQLDVVPASALVGGAR